MEYAKLGDLYSLIKHYKRHQKYFDEILLWRIAYEVLNGLEYLHSNNIIHRDIKCLNLFLSKDYHVKIGDLGVSTISALGGMHCTRVGTPLYLSPELIKQIPYDYKTDIWSFGCSLYHLSCLEPPFTGNNLIVLGNNIVKGRPRELPNIYSNELKFFINKMLTKKPDKRPSAKEAKELIPKSMLDKIFLAYKNKIEIKSRPFSSIGNRTSIDNNNNANNNVNNLNNNLNNNVNNNINNNSNNNINNKISEEKNNNKKDNKKEINKDNNKELDEKNNNNENNKEININNNNNSNKNNINNVISINRNDINLKEKKGGSNSLDQNMNKINKFTLDSNINSNDNNNINEVDITNEDKKNLKIKQNNNLGEKCTSLYNVLNIQKGFNFFRTNLHYKKPKDRLFSKHNIISSNNKIINNNNKNNSIKVYSSAFKKELMEFQNDKKSPKFSEEEKITILSQKKEEKKPFSTDTNIQFISINNNNISSNNNSNTNNTNTNHSNNTNNINSIKSKEIATKNNQDKKQIKKEKEPQTSRISAEKNNILFPNLKVNDHMVKENLIFNDNKKISQNQEKKRPFSSGGKFKPHTNRNIGASFNKNFLNKDLSLNNGLHKKLNSGRPSTGFKPNFKNNVMNININFFNIDMNRRFLAPEINPLNLNDIENNEDTQAKKDFTLKKNNNYASNINLRDYQDTNEFIFQKLIKAIQDINNQKKLTINDLQ